jgi:hypothetical protein
MFVSFSSFFAPGMPAAYDTLNSNPFFYWGVSTRTPTSGRRWPILRGPYYSTGELYKDAYKLRIFFKNASGRRLAHFTWSQAGLPRTTKDKLAHC